MSARVKTKTTEKSNVIDGRFFLSAMKFRTGMHYIVYAVNEDGTPNERCHLGAIHWGSMRPMRTTPAGYRVRSSRWSRGWIASPEKSSFFLDQRPIPQVYGSRREAIEAMVEFLRTTKYGRERLAKGGLS